MTDAQPLFIRVSDVHRVFGVSESTIRRHAKADAITIYKRGGASLLKVAEVAAWIEKGDGSDVSPKPSR